MGRQAKYRQVADSVLAGLRREGAGPGYKLPNVRDLARTHGTSVFTVTKALDLLEARGIVDRRWAVGCFLSRKGLRELRDSFSPAIGILLHPHRVLGDGWTQGLLSALLDAIRAAGAQPVYASWTPDMELPARLDGLVADPTPVFEAPEFAGTPSAMGWLRKVAASGFPVVTVDFHIPEAAAVEIDNAGGAYQLGRYLVQLGHREICYRGEPGWANSDERLAGLRKALAEAGIPHDDSLVWQGPAKPREAMREFPARYASRPFSAVCCFEDLAAAGIVRAALDMGLRIPEDLSVAGFGNLTLGEFAALPVTTVDVQQGELARQAVRLLFEMVRTGKSSPARVRVPAQLLVKQTTGPLAPIRRAIRPSHGR